MPVQNSYIKITSIFQQIEQSAVNVGQQYGSVSTATAVSTLPFADIV